MQKSVLLLLAALAGCTSNASSGPPSVSETSAARQTLQDRIGFVERYVTFRRSYINLEYDVQYRNNGGGTFSGPSEWDIRILAVVPADELDDWIPPDATPTTRQPPAWSTALSDDIPANNITEWYEVAGSEIGVDRMASTVAYRNAAD